MTKKGKTLGIGIVAMAIVGAGVWALSPESAGRLYEVFESPVERASIRTTIAATGQVEAMVTVEVGSQVTGQVQTIFADFNSIVTEGQILAQLDPRHVEAQLRNSEANLRSAESRILTAQADRGNADANLETAHASLSAAEFNLELAERNSGRMEGMFADGLVAETQLEAAATTVQSTRAALLNQQSSLAQAAAQIISRDAALEQAYAAVEQAVAEVEEARLNLAYTTIRSPIDGVVISREVDVGQTMSASTSAPTLFVIANDLAQMRVQANIDEADIGLLGRSKPVTFGVDAYPDQEFEGHIQEIRLNPSTSQNVVTYSVVVVFDNPGFKVKPGMTANIVITVESRDDVLTVPNTSLRYAPPNMPADMPEPSRPGEANGSRPSAATAASIVSSGIPDRSTEGLTAAITDPVISSVYMVGQEWLDSDKVQFKAAAPAPPRPGRVWIMNEAGVAEARDLVLGLTDGSRTEVLSGDLTTGELVLVGDTSNLAPETSSSPSGNAGNVFRAISGGGGFNR